MTDRITICALRALAYDLHTWRSRLANLRNTDICDVDELIIPTEALIEWITVEQAQVLIDRVARSADYV